MLIRKVELENIKNYDSASYEFDAGVTAISGPNGAGKTTILEAIAFALFDHLPYKKEDFLKRGAKKGTVRVTFVSAVDGREYTVNRDTSTGYYVFDPITKARLVEQKAQVSNWVREHLGVEAGTDLKTLFTSSIGVPQGTFTVDFAEQPARRKLSFDKVLRVDEYQGAADEMRGVVRHIEAQDAQLKEEIARFEGELSALDGLLAERSRREMDHARLTEEIVLAEKQQVGLRGELDRFDALLRRIEQLAGEEVSLIAQVEALSRQKITLTEEVRQCEQAKKLMTAATDGYEGYKEAVEKLAQLEPEIVKRDELKQHLVQLERECYRMEATRHALKEKIGQIKADKKASQELQPLVEEQDALERRRHNLQSEITELQVLKRRAAQDERELISLRNEYHDLTKRLEEAEEVKALAERLPALEQGRQLVLKELREAELACERLMLKQKEAKRSTETLAKRAGEIQTLETELAAAGNPEELIQALPGLEKEDRALMEQATSLRLKIDREEKFSKEVKDGMCPLLSQRCLNIKDGQGLDQFFQLQLRDERDQLKRVERKRIEIQRQLSEARQAERMSAAIAAQRTQLARYQQDYEVEARALAKLKKEVAGLGGDKTKLASLKERLKALEAELRQAQTAREKYASAVVMRERLDVLRIEGKEKREAFERVKERLEALSRLSEELQTIEEMLLKLGDAKGKSAALSINIAKEEEVLAAIAKAEEEERQLRVAVDEIEKALAAYNDLDEQLARWRERRSTQAKDYQVYIENQPVAASLESKRQALDAVDDTISKAQENLEQVAGGLEAAKSEYDGEQHDTTRKRLSEVTHQLGFLAAELNNTHRRLLELKDEIDRLLVTKQQVDALVAERDKWEQIHSASDLIRDLLKKAGPFVTEAHLQAVSLEANSLYREVTGNPMVSLKWDPGYEVILEEDGHERPFISLSGGEQMAAALSVRLALLKELSDVRIAFFDEPTTNMDEERRRNLAQQIGRIKDFNQLFVISHDDTFEGFTDRVITVGEVS